MRTGEIGLFFITAQLRVPMLRISGHVHTLVIARHFLPFTFSRVFLILTEVPDLLFTVLCIFIYIYKNIHIFLVIACIERRQRGGCDMGGYYRYTKGVPIEAQYLFQESDGDFQVWQPRKRPEIPQTDNCNRSWLFKSTF